MSPKDLIAWHLPCCPFALAPITEIFINDVSGFREELNQTVPDIGQTPTVRNCCFCCVSYLFPSVTSGFSG